MRKLLHIIPWWQDSICERIDSLLKGQYISPRIEAVIFYIYKEKSLPFILSNSEENELFDVLERCVGSKETIKVLEAYFSQCGFPSNHAVYLLNKLIRSYNISNETSATFCALADLKFSADEDFALDYIDRKEHEILNDIKYYLKCKENKYGSKVLHEIEKDVWLNIRCLLDVVDTLDETDNEFFKTTKLFTILKKAISNGEDNIHHVVMDFVEQKR